MAREPKKDVDHFLIWKPRRRLMNLLEDYLDKKEAFKKFRNASSSYIQNKRLRAYILDKFNNKCVLCDSVNSLEIDHIESVLSCFKKEKFQFCNSEENLQVLCKKCNSSKAP